MTIVNASPQVSAYVYKGDGCDSMPMARWSGGGGKKWHFLRTFFMDEPVSHNLSRNLSRKNTKP